MAETLAFKTDGVDTAERQSQIVEQMELLSGNVNALENSFTELIDRIEPLLRPQSPEVDSEKKTDKDLVPLADDLRGLNRRLNKVASYLTNTIQRLEL